VPFKPGKVPLTPKASQLKPQPGKTPGRLMSVAMEYFPRRDSARTRHYGALFSDHQLTGLTTHIGG